MNSENPSPLEDWIDEAPAAIKKSPADYARPISGLAVGTAAGTAVVWGLLMLLARSSLMGAFIASITGAMLGITLTLLGMAWGSAIVFADSSRKGIWFSLFPPYMVLYAIRHWGWMRQPTVLFLSGLTLAFGSIYGTMWLGPMSPRL